ncbi:predicted protein [Aspergillus terreus NIH2624]|uniref:Uncharacterized protein n=1 Tax=Aspergillus terreus (strain NIH 2624 / FGSC A1156) TaxID=341663 RepID=Q0CAR3_ASPTN|nr:uncharacterized protein ATEG_09221 [Aspergillus terreus NIH2624]EAU30358.1 predicted protein [Aspergillus terreus NIH2624]
MEFAERRTRLIQHLLLARRRRRHLRPRSKGETQLGRGDVLFAAAGGVSLALVVADVQHAGGVLHEVGELVLLGVDVDVEGPRRGGGFSARGGLGLPAGQRGGDGERAFDGPAGCRGGGGFGNGGATGGGAHRLRGAAHGLDGRGRFAWGGRRRLQWLARRGRNGGGGGGGGLARRRVSRDGGQGHARGLDGLGRAVGLEGVGVVGVLVAAAFAFGGKTRDRVDVFGVHDGQRLSLGCEKA